MHRPHTLLLRQLNWHNQQRLGMQEGTLHRRTHGRLTGNPNHMPRGLWEEVHIVHRSLHHSTQPVVLYKWVETLDSTNMVTRTRARHCRLPNHG